jgi:hypothetical protein
MVFSFLLAVCYTTYGLRGTGFSSSFVFPISEGFNNDYIFEYLMVYVYSLQSSTINLSMKKIKRIAPLSKTRLSTTFLRKRHRGRPNNPDLAVMQRNAIRK